MLAGSEEGARVVLAPEDVSIIEEENETVAIEADRLKALGSYKIEIRLKGVDPIQRLVIIRPQETEI